MRKQKNILKIGSEKHPDYMGTKNLVFTGNSIFHKNIPLMRKYWNKKK